MNINEQVNNKLTQDVGTLWDQLSIQVRNKCWDKVSFRLWNQVHDQIKNKISDQLWRSIK
jgi:hypothetical protein